MELTQRELKTVYEGLEKGVDKLSEESDYDSMRKRHEALKVMKKIRTKIPEVVIDWE